MLSNAYFLAKFRFDTAENEPAKNLQMLQKIAIRYTGAGTARTGAYRPVLYRPPSDDLPERVHGALLLLELRCFPDRGSIGRWLRHPLSLGARFFLRF